MESKTMSTEPNAPDAPTSIHMQNLEKAFDKATTKCVSSFKLSMLKQHFKPIYQKNPKILKSLHQDASEQLATNIKEELVAVFEEENIQDFMAKLDQMTEQAERMDEDLEAWRPTGVPSEDVRAHLYPVQQQHLHQLEKVFDQLQSQNTLLRRNLDKAKGRLLQTRASVTSDLNTWKQAKCLSAEDCQELEAYMKRS